MTDISSVIWDAVESCNEVKSIEALKAADAEIERLRAERENLRQIWQLECDKPSGRFEDRAVFYNMFASDNRAFSEAEK